VSLPAPFRYEGEHLAIDLPGGGALFTTRRGGVSRGPFASLNLGTATGDGAGESTLGWGVACEVAASEAW